jgi:predicted DNA-binding transcriptional regulator YafY
MNRIDRLFAILTLLQSKKYVTAEKIADKFQLSIRTVYRDIKAIAESGIPVSFEPGKGYFIVQGYFLPPVSFTTEEANAFLLMEAMVTGFADQSIKKNYSSGLNKIKALLGVSQQDSMETLSEHIKIQIPPSLQTNHHFLSIIQHAITSKCMLELDYRNNNGEKSKRQIEPIGLVFYALTWHTIAWCHQRKAYRDFKVARIIKLQNNMQAFKKKDHIDLNSYMKMLPVNY